MAGYTLNRYGVIKVQTDTTDTETLRVLQCRLGVVRIKIITKMLITKLY